MQLNIRKVFLINVLCTQCIFTFKRVYGVHVSMRNVYWECIMCKYGCVLCMYVHRELAWFSGVMGKYPNDIVVFQIWSESCKVSATPVRQLTS
jgi:hypothetical protein